jgi:hypothetical protein
MTRPAAWNGCEIAAAVPMVAFARKPSPIYLCEADLAAPFTAINAAQLTASRADVAGQTWPAEPGRAKAARRADPRSRGSAGPPRGLPTGAAAHSSGIGRSVPAAATPIRTRGDGLGGRTGRFGPTSSRSRLSTGTSRRASCALGARRPLRRLQRSGRRTARPVLAHETGLFACTPRPRTSARVWRPRPRSSGDGAPSCNPPPRPTLASRAARCQQSSGRSGGRWARHNGIQPAPCAGRRARVHCVPPFRTCGRAATAACGAWRHV